MNLKDLLATCTQILSEVLKIAPEKIGLESNINSDLGADSLDVLRIAMRVEERFGLHLTMNDLNGLQTLDDMVRSLECKLAESSIDQGSK